MTNKFSRVAQHKANTNQRHFFSELSENENNKPNPVYDRLQQHGVLQSRQTLYSKDIDKWAGIPCWNLIQFRCQYSQINGILSLKALLESQMVLGQ